MTRLSLLKLAFATLAFASICASNANAREEQPSRENAQVDYSGYQGPHGHYADLADFTRSINGTPCGIECTRSHEELWAPRQR
jgi:hypothetical protein